MQAVFTRQENRELKMTKLHGSIDTNVVLRLILADIPEQYVLARQLFDKSKQLEISDTCLIETIYALHEYYLIPRAKVKKTILDLATNKKLIINTDVFEPTLDMYVLRPALSIEDCYLALLAKYHDKQPLWTFDKKLAKQSGGLAKEVGTI